jgi:predicted transcriptional regulator
MEDFLILEKDSFDLKAELKSIGMTQKDFAEHIDKSVFTITRWVKGDLKIPKLVKLYIKAFKKTKILEELNISVK